MSSAGSVSLQLVLERNKFDQDLTKLQQEKVGAIAVKLKLDTKDFERQIKGLAGFIPPVDVPVHLDIQPQAVKKQFEQIGRYAAAGFAQGFSGAEDAGKSAVDSMVKSVKQQLGIQSPSKVFRQIGKYAAQGLLEGLQIKASDVRAITKSLEEEFKKSNISLGKVKASIDLDANSISGDLASAVEKGVRNASTKSIFASLTGGLLKAVGGVGAGLLSAFLLPVKAVAGVAAIAFTGAGLKLGEDLGAGVSGGLKNAIKSALGNSIGSGEVVGEAIGETLTKGIAAAIEAAFPNILKSMGEQARQVLGEEKVFTAGAIGRSQAQATKQQRKEVAGAQLQKEYARATRGGNPERVKQLKSEISGLEPQLQADSTALYTEIDAEQQRLQQVAAKFKVKLTPEKLIKLRVKEYERQLKFFEQKAAQLEAEGDTAGANKAKAAIEKLQRPDEDPSKISNEELTSEEERQLNKIRARFELREVNKQFGDRRSQLQERQAQLNTKKEEYTKEWGQLNPAAKAQILKPEIDAVAPQLKTDSKEFASELAAEQQRLQKIAAKFRVTLTPERLIKRRIKDYEEQVKRFEKIIAQLEKEGDTQKAGQVRAALGQLKRPDEDPSKISQKELRMAENLQVSKIRNQFVSRELGQRFGARGAELEQRKAQLAPKVQEYNTASGRVNAAARAVEVLGVNPFPQQPTKKAVTPQPQAYQKILDQVLSLSGVGNISPELIPELKVSDKLRPGALGTYNPDNNQINVSKEAYELIQKGKMDAKAIETLVHELRHAVQFDFGRADVAAKNQAAVPLLAPNKAEVKKIGRNIESSVEVQKPELQPISRKLEADAYTFALRNAPKVQQQIRKDSFESSVGIGGSKADLQIKRSQIDAVKRLSSIGQLAKGYGVDVRRELELSAQNLDKLALSISPLLERANNLDALSDADITQLQSELESALTEIITQIQNEPERLKGVVKEKLQQPKQPEKSNALEANLNRLNATDIRALSKDLGVPTYNKEAKKNFTKPELIQSLLKVDPQKLEAKLPSIGKPAPEVLAQAKLLSQLPTDQLKLQLKTVSTQLGQAFKQGKNDANLLQKVLDDIQKQEELVSQALAQNLEEGAKNQLEGFRLGLSKRKYQAKGELGRLNLQQQSSASNRPVPTVGQMAGGNSFELPAFENVDDILAAARAQLNKFISQARNGKTNSSAYGDYYGRRIKEPISQMESEAKSAEAAAKGVNTRIERFLARQQRFRTNRVNRASTRMESGAQSAEASAQKEAAKTARSLQVAQKLIAEAEARQKVQAQLNARLARLEQWNEVDPSVAADVAIADVNKNKQRRDRTIAQIRANPRKFLQERSKNAVVQKARYITENAEGISNLVGAKVGDEPTPKQAANLVGLQSAFGNLGEAATKFGQKQSKKNFQELDTAVKELESSLRKLGIPFTLINKEIDNYTQNLRQLQGEGKIDLDVDVDSLAPEKFSIIDNLMAKFSGLELKGVKAIAGLVKGFFALTALSFVQRIFTDIGQGAFRAYVELDRLKTTLNFASGGPSGGARNLEFVRKTVDDLRVPLQASAEGFTQMAAAARGSAIEGEQTRQLFLGISQASSVLSLSADNSKGAVLALSQMMSKGKVQAEEMRLQLGERIPGALGIASRAMGLTQEEFTRLMESGQLLSENFLPKFAKQLQAEFGEASKGASQNASSAVFALENATLSLQQGLGEAVAPAAMAGLNALSATMNGLASVAQELGFILLAVITTLGVKMAIALKAVIANLIATKLVTGTLGGGFAALAQTINNSFSAKLTLGIFAVLEVIKLLNDAVNTGLVKSFEDAAKSAKNAADQSRKAFESAKGNKPSTTEPESSSGVGRFLDRYLIGALNTGNDKFRLGNLLAPGGMGFGDKLQTYGGLEQQRVGQAIATNAASSNDLIASGRLRLAQLKTGTGDIGKLRAVDGELRDAEQQRQIVKADIDRDYIQKGIAIPAEAKAQLATLDLQIRKLNELRSEASTPFTLDISRVDLQINSLKSQLENLAQPDAIAAVGGEEAAEGLRKQIQSSLESLRTFKYEAEAALASLRVDPILSFTQALRSLNLALGESRERNEQGFNAAREMIANSQVAGFSSNPMAARSANLQNALNERDRSSKDVTALEQAVEATNATINAPELQSTLRRLGVSPESTVAKIDDVLKNTQDDADKAILERLKAALEQRNQLSSARAGLAESGLKVKQATQDNSLFEIEESAAKSRAATQKGENSKIAKVRDAEALRLIEAEEAAEKISRIQLQSTQSQMKNLDMQLAMLRAYYEQGAISAEEFARRERDLTTEQTNLDRTEAENRLAVVVAMKDRRLKLIETMNKEAEAAIALSQTTATTGVKMGILGADLDGQQAAQAQNFVDQEATKDKIHLLKQQIDQTKELRQQGLLTAREATEKELALNQELAQANQQLIDQQIQAQEQLRAAIEKTFERRKAQLDLENGQRDTQVQGDALATFATSPALDLRGLELDTSGKSLENKQAFLAAQKALVEEQLAGIDKLNLAEQDAADKKRQILSELDRLTRDQISTQKDLITNKQEREINGIERLKAAEENRFKLATSGLDSQKAKLDLYSQSLERSAKLSESRANLSKASSDAGVALSGTRLDSANRALELSRRLKDGDLDPNVRSEITRQLSQSGFGTNELEILEKRSRIEDEIAAQKMAAMQAEQAHQQQSLALDMKRQKIAAQMAIYEAESAQLTAAKSKIEAESALKIAEAKKDDLGIESAKIAIELANRETDLSNKKLENAIANLKIQGELATNAMAAQAATQGSAVSQQLAADAARKQAFALERVEAMSLKGGGGKGGTSLGAEDADNPFRRLTLDEVKERAKAEKEKKKVRYESDFDYAKRITQARMEGRIQDFRNTTSTIDYSGYHKGLALDKVAGAMPLKDTTAEAVKAASSIDPVGLDSGATFTNALNDSLGHRLDTLNERILQLANSPRSLTVQSPNAVDDAASIMNDLARKQVAGAGI